MNLHQQFARRGMSCSGANSTYNGGLIPFPPPFRIPGEVAEVG